MPKSVAQTVSKWVYTGDTNSSIDADRMPFEVQFPYGWSLQLILASEINNGGGATIEKIGYFPRKYFYYNDRNDQHLFFKAVPPSESLTDLASTNYHDAYQYGATEVWNGTVPVLTAGQWHDITITPFNLPAGHHLLVYWEDHDGTNEEFGWQLVMWKATPMPNMNMCQYDMSYPGNLIYLERPNDRPNNRFLLTLPAANFTVTATTNDTSYGTTTGSGTYSEATQATLTASANYGYLFSNWTSNGNILSTANPFTFMVMGDTTITANFAADSFAVTTAVNSAAFGSVSGDGNYAYNTQATLTAIANNGYKFANWRNKGVLISTANPFSLTVMSDTSLTANFVLDTFVVIAR
jgi:hypothetical protein